MRTPVVILLTLFAFVSAISAGASQLALDADEPLPPLEDDAFFDAHLYDGDSVHSTTTTPPPLAVDPLMPARKVKDAAASLFEQLGDA